MKIRALLILAMSIGAMPHANAQIANLPPEIAAKIVALGPVLDANLTATTFAMFRALPRAADPGVALASDLRYGPDERNRLDVYQPADSRSGANHPVLVFIHGGGFVRGDKALDATYYGNIGRFFASHGIVAVVPSYRLAPAHPWPAGTEDVAAAVAWTHANIASKGGDPDRIVVSGQSAGAIHAAAYLFDPQLGPKPDSGVIGGILGSGIYEMTEADKSDSNTAYYGNNPRRYAERAPLAHGIPGKLPMFLYTAEFDPPFLAEPTYQLAAKLCARDGKCPKFFYAAGHNHISEVAMIGTADSALGDAMVDFINTLKSPAGRP